MKPVAKSLVPRNAKLSSDVAQDITEEHTKEKSIEHSSNIQNVTVHKSTSGGVKNKFIDERRKEIRGLIENGTFKVAERFHEEKDTSIFWFKIFRFSKTTR